MCNPCICISIRMLFIITIKTNEALPVSPSANISFTKNNKFLKPKMNSNSFTPFIFSQAWSEIHVYLSFAA